ncbi:MAG: 2-hydroxyacyl-CoA dehydratase, partial [Deltaproteobacteria bacterium]|nr:2-hydroxyacyl-CoA dehydratase [Deltaproteobacteria bacterium]
EELEKRQADKVGSLPLARIRLTGSPVLWPDFKLVELLIKSGADVVADEMCSGTQRLYNPTVVDEWTKPGLIRAAAERVLLPCTCPCFSKGSRLDRLTELVKNYKVDGIIHHSLRLCQLYGLDSQAVASQFKKRRLPWLEIHSEFGPEDAGRMNNQIEAFIEMLQVDR